MEKKKYYHIPTGKYYHNNGASGLISEDCDSPIPLWLVENSKDWVIFNFTSENEYRKILTDLVLQNPNEESIEYLLEYINNTKFTISNCGHFMIDSYDSRIKFLIKPFNH